MKRIFVLLAILLVAGLPVLTTGCEPKSETEQQVEEMGEAMEDAGEEMQDDAEEIADEIEDAPPATPQQ